MSDDNQIGEVYSNSKIQHQLQFNATQVVPLKIIHILVGTIKLALVTY